MLEKLQHFFQAKGFACSSEQLRQLNDLRSLVLEWNGKVNLTSITDRDAFEERHLIDSAAICSDLPFLEASRILDLGCGGGFPGLVLAIMFPVKQFALLDSIEKKIKIVQDISDRLGLKNVRVICGRAEEIAAEKSEREQYDVCVSRAVAAMPVLLEYALPFIKVGGSFAAYKSSEGLDGEIKSAEPALKVLGGEISSPELSQSIGNQKHIIVWFKKVRPCPKEYPRKIGQAKKNPIMDPFYCTTNMRHLAKSIDEVESGNGITHELIDAL